MVDVSSPNPMMVTLVPPATGPYSGLTDLPLPAVVVMEVVVTGVVVTVVVETTSAATVVLAVAVVDSLQVVTLAVMVANLL